MCVCVCAYGAGEHPRSAGPLRHPHPQQGALVGKEFQFKNFVLMS